jgi:hypothetical protein
MTRVTLIRIAVIAVAIALFAWWMHFRSASVQAPRTFARIARAIHLGNADGVIGEIHPDYDFKAHWPEQLADFGAYNPRLVARQGLLSFFERFDKDPIGCSVNVDSVTENENVIDVVISMRFVTRGGDSNLNELAPILQHHFKLARDGWMSPKLLIIGHDPIHVYE